MRSPLVRFTTLASFAALLAPSIARADIGPIPAEHPATCRHALRQYASLGDVPRPYLTLDLASADPTWPAWLDEPLDRAARVGATGYVYLQVPGTLGSNQERAMRRNGARSMYRTVAVLVPSDTARAYDACRRTIRSY